MHSIPYITLHTSAMEPMQFIRVFCTSQLNYYYFSMVTNELINQNLSEKVQQIEKMYKKIETNVKKNQNNNITVDFETN